MDPKHHCTLDSSLANFETICDVGMDTDNPCSLLVFIRNGQNVRGAVQKFQSWVIPLLHRGRPNATAGKKEKGHATAIGIFDVDRGIVQPAKANEVVLRYGLCRWQILRGE
jgi:hypothetical protein